MQEMLARRSELAANCGRIALFETGETQGFACVLNVCPQQQTINSCTANTADFFDLEPTDLIGQPLGSLFQGQLERLVKHQHPLTPRPKVVFEALSHKGDAYHVGLSMNPEQLQIEIEPATSSSISDTHRQSLLLAPIRVEQLRTFKSLLRAHCERLEQIVPFERVLVFQFHDDWSGSVVLERNTTGDPDYMGLRFPASDVPENARQHYRYLPSRMILNDGRETTSIVGQGSHPKADVRYLHSRACATTHLSYLTNMKVTTAFSCSIAQNLVRPQDLWGLVSFHSKKRVHIDLRDRMACEAITRSLSLQAQNFRINERMQLHENFESHALLTIMGRGYKEPIPDLPDRLLTRAMEQLDAAGAALVQRDRIRLHGKTPQESDVRRVLAAILAGEWCGEGSVFGHDRICDLVPEGIDYSDVAAGVMATSTQRLSRVEETNAPVLLFFRPSQEATVLWAGRNDEFETTHTDDGLEVISPRVSFEAWKEERKHCCKAWSSVERYLAIMWGKKLINLELF